MFGLDSESDILNVNSQDWGRWEVYGEDGKLLHVDDHPVRKAAMTAKPVIGQLVAVRNPGANGPTWMLINAEPLLREDGTVYTVVSTYHDVTERKRMEEELRASERRERERAEELATMLEAVPTPVIIVHDPDSTHMTGNLAADELLRQAHGTEFSLSAPLDVKPAHFRPMKDGRELTLAKLPAQRAARGEQVRDFEFSLVFDDGAVRHRWLTVHPCGTIKGSLAGSPHIGGHYRTQGDGRNTTSG